MYRMYPSNLQHCFCIHHPFKSLYSWPADETRSTDKTKTFGTQTIYLILMIVSIYVYRMSQLRERKRDELTEMVYINISVSHAATFIPSLPSCRERSLNIHILQKMKLFNNSLSLYTLSSSYTTSCFVTGSFRLIIRSV